jgi:hypothetical protein
MRLECTIIQEMAMVPTAIQHQVSRATHQDKTKEMK